MIEKKETGGLEDDNTDLIQPSDNQELNTNNLINTVAAQKPATINGTSGLELLTTLQDVGFGSSYTDFNTSDKDNFSEYQRLIDGPFSLSDSNIDDRRADGQSLGEKALYSYGAKLVPKIGVHVIGSTVGLLDGLAEVAKDAYMNGFASSNFNKFFNNDFQKSLDDYNKSLDNKFPNYYHSQEKDLNTLQSIFGKGAANFWTNDFSQGLSFVAGAVLSELATAGTASFMIGPKAALKLKGIAAIRNTTYGAKAIKANKNLQKINRAERIYDGLTTGRRLMTGAFYESGVEARHNYDSIVQNLKAMHVERGEKLTPEDNAKINQVAIQVSNGVFAGNAALVGYSNMLMFRRVFGSGLKANNKFKNKITKGPDGKYVSKHKSWGNARRRFEKSKAVVGIPLYEGFVEEGGQKTLDIAGQYAAEDMYLNDENPSQLKAVGQIMNHTFDGMAEAYSSTEGQKEIFLGVVLAALGLPSFQRTNEKGEKEYGLFYGDTGGVKDFFNRYKEGNQQVDDVVTYMNENPDAIAGIKANFDMLVGIKNAEDERDLADATDNDFAYKNADHDQFFAFVFSRLQGGYYGDVVQSLEDIKDMDLDSFEAMFNYEDQTSEMSTQDRKTFLNERKNTVIDTHKERAEKIKEVYESLDNTTIGPKGKKTIAQALSSTANLDEREQSLIDNLEELMGVSLSATVTEEKTVKDSKANDSIISKVKSFVMDRLPAKVKNLLETSETGLEVKREIGVKEFTEPGHPIIVYQKMMQKLQQLKIQLENHEKNDDVDGYVEVGDKIETLEKEMLILNKGIRDGSAPDISSEEQQVLDEYKKKDPAGYELNKGDIIKKLQDLRRIRAKRHQMLNLVQQLLDPNAYQDKIQQLEEQVQDVLSEQERKSLPPEEQALIRKYKGKIIEFDYVDKNGVTRTHRVHVKDSNNIVKLPNEETFKLLQRQKLLLDKKFPSQDDLAELDLIAEELKKGNHVSKGAKPMTIGVLKSASNIKVLTDNELILKQLEAVTSVLQEDLTQRLSEAVSSVEDARKAITDIARIIKDIKVAISKAKNNTRGDLRVNLNAIGRGTQNKTETALKLIEEAKETERALREQLKTFIEDVQVLNDNALRIQLIQSALTNPNAISTVLKKNATTEDVMQFIQDALGLTSLEDFYKKIGEDGYFDTNSLTELAGQKNKDGGYDIDLEILDDLLKLTGNNISKEYLDLMNADLAHFRNELELLTKHRGDVEKILNRMLDPEGNPLMFPPQGLTADDLNSLSYELNSVETDIKTLQGIVNMLEAETEQNMIDANASDVFTARANAAQTQNDILQALNQYRNWLDSVTEEPAEQAEDKDGDSVLTPEIEESLLQQERNDRSPALSNVGWTKTAGYHKAALDRYNTFFKEKIQNGVQLTAAEALELKHVESQLRFFRKSYEIFNYSKKTGAKLIAVTRNNIRPEWAEEIVFYDIQRAQSKGRYDDPTNFQYAADLLKNEENDESLENIKLLLVDANNEPILLDGKLVYTDMNSSSESTLAGRFKGQKDKDLNEDGSLGEGLLEAQESFIALRNQLLSDTQERTLLITRKSRGYEIKDPSGLNPGIGRLQINTGGRLKTAKEKDLKDIRLELALPSKGSKGADQMVPLFGFKVTSRFAYFGTSKNGYLGTDNLVPAVISLLSEGQVNNIYNLSRYFAENDKGGIDLGGKGFTAILKEQIFYGERSAEREQKKFSIYMKEDAIYFGENNSISLEQLKDPSKFDTIHQEYKDFLRTLYFNINSTSLNTDVKARIQATKKGIKTNTFINPEYTPFNEVIVNDDLTTDVKEWDNYTHYLLSDVGRDSANVPVKTNLTLATSPNVDQRFTPQFGNVYFEHSSFAQTQEQLNSTKQDSTKEPAPVVNTNTQKKMATITLDDGSTFQVELESDINVINKVTKVEAGVEEETKDTLDDSPFSQSNEELDSPFFLYNMQEPSSDVNLKEELKWFNDNMPKDENGNPIVNIEIIRGLIDGKAFGKFTKDGNILLSNVLNTEGIVYHESWHAITRKFISKDSRFAMYNEVRGMRGSTVTYKGETKKMAQLTDKEADEWLAEEFREYVLSGGSYNVGGRIQKSIFDRILNFLSFFVTNKSQAQDLMSRINSGYFSDPNTEITVYDSKEEAYYEGTKLTAEMRNNVMEGMTAIVFNKGLKANLFNLEDFTDPNKTSQRNAAIRSLYGEVGEDSTVHSQIKLHIKAQVDKATNQADIDNLTKTMNAINTNWKQLQDEHIEYVKRFQIDITEEGEELERIREQFGKPQNEIDPSTYLPKAVRLLIATLPLTDGKAFAVNSSGLPKLVDFGSTMNFLYKEFANADPAKFQENLKRAAKKNSSIKVMRIRLGLDTNDISDFTSNQIRLVVQTMLQLDQSNNTFYTQLITREGGRKLINSNQNRIEDKIKLLWTNQFKENIQGNSALGTDVNGELILNKKAKVKIGTKNKTFENWAKDNRRTPQESLIVLSNLGVTFTNPEMFTQMYIEDSEVRAAVDYILQDVYNQPVSNIFKGDIQSNLKTLVNLEAKTNTTNVDLQHRSPDGKTIHGVNLKTYADVLVSKLTKIGDTGERVVNTEEVAKLLKYDNLKNSVYLKNMLTDPSVPLEVAVLQGIEQIGGRGKLISKGSPVDIGTMMINALLIEGIAPILRTADKKTEFGLKYKWTNNAIRPQEMVDILKGYLADEIRVASKFITSKKSKLRRVDTLKDNGSSLRFFKGIVSLSATTYGKKLNDSEITEIVNSPEITKELSDFLNQEVSQARETAETYNLQNGLDVTLTTAEEFDPIEQFTYEYMIATNEQGKLLLGDFALYSDLFKRTSGISGTKAYPTSDANVLNWMNQNMPNLLSNTEHTENLRVSNRQGIKAEAPYLEQYMATLELMGMSTEFMNNVNDVYSNMEEFDGGGFITLDAYRSLMYRTGKWTQPQEEFYQKIAEGKEITTNDMALIPPIKPQLFGPQIIDNQRLMTFHKFALFPIIPGVGGIMSNTAFDNINEDMIENNIDYMIFESAVKVGGITTKKGYDPFYEELPTGAYSVYKDMELDEKGQPLGLQELNFSDLGIQVEMAPKTKDEVTEGSQSRSLLPINVYDKGELSEGYEQFESLIDRYHEVNEELVSRDFNSLLTKLKLAKDSSGVYKLQSEDLEEFKEAIISEFKKRDNPLHTIDAISKLLDGDTKFIEQLFEKNKIESLLYSLVNNNVVKRKMPGGQFVLQAATGFESEIRALTQEDFEISNKDNTDLHTNKLKPLKFYRKSDPNNLKSETLAMQVYLPSRFKDQMGVLEEDISLVDPELLQLIGFRIPTEGLNSIDFIEVVGFLPKHFGDTVIVPTEIVGKAGSDYDIDKLSIYFPNANKEGNRIKFDSTKTTKQQSKQALQNEMQTIMRDVLSHPASFDQLISPVGASTLKKVAKEIAMLRNPEMFSLNGTKMKPNLNKMLRLENMINTSYRMFSGLGGIGIVATSSTQHAKGQRPGLNWNFKGNEDIVFNFAGEGFGLSSVYDVQGEDKISGTIGQYVTGYVDVTKEDFVFDINAGIENAPIHMLLIRSGVPLREVAFFMSQPILDDYVQMKQLNQPMYAFRALMSDEAIVDQLISKYGGQTSRDIKFTEEGLKGMVGKNIDQLETLEKRKQVQVLQDFLRYKDLAEDLLILKDASSVDTSRMANGVTVRYTKQLINRLEQDGKFVNLDELLYGNKEGASTVAGYTKLLNETDGMFADFKVGEYITEAKTFIDNKLFELTDKDLKVNKEDAINRMSKFENFLATTIVQNTAWEYNKIKDRGRELFIGKNSLPRRINTLKGLPKYANNLLMQELTPILQVFTENNLDSTVDGLRLFSKKLQPYDIDLLADSFMELKEVNPSLATDLIMFSALQSGYEFSPSSFFQVIPGTEVLDVLAPYFKQNKNINRTSNLINEKSMNSLWEDFHKNYSGDTSIVPNVYRKAIGNQALLYKNDNFVSITTIIGTSIEYGKVVNKYDTFLFKNTGIEGKTGQMVYEKIDKKGVKNAFVEATGTMTPSIVNRNTGVLAKKSVSDPEISNTTLTVKRNLNNEIQGVLNEKDKGCK